MKRIRITTTVVQYADVPDELVEGCHPDGTFDTEHDMGITEYLNNDGWPNVVDELDNAQIVFTMTDFIPLAPAPVHIICLYGHKINVIIDTDDYIDWSEESEIKSGIINMMADNETSGDLWKGDIIGTWAVV